MEGLIPLSRFRTMANLRIIKYIEWKINSIITVHRSGIRAAKDVCSSSCPRFWRKIT